MSVFSAMLGLVALAACAVFIRRIFAPIVDIRDVFDELDEAYIEPGSVRVSSDPKDAWEHVYQFTCGKAGVIYFVGRRKGVLSESLLCSMQGLRGCILATFINGIILEPKRSVLTGNYEYYVQDGYIAHQVLCIARDVVEHMSFTHAQ